MEREPEYILINARELQKVDDLYFAERMVLWAMVKNCTNSKDYGLIVILTDKVKGEILEWGKWKNPRSMNNAISNLISKGLIERLSKGTFKLNPDIFIKKGGYKKRA